MGYERIKHKILSLALILLMVLNAGHSVETLYEAESAMLTGREPGYHSDASGDFRVRYFDEPGDSILS